MAKSRNSFGSAFLADTPEIASPKTKRKLRMAQTQNVDSMTVKLFKKSTQSPHSKKKSGKKGVNQSTDFGSNSLEQHQQSPVLSFNTRGHKDSRLRASKTMMSNSRMSGTATKLGEEQPSQVDGNLRISMTSSMEHERAEGEAEKQEKGSDAVSSDYESMMRECDPVKRNIKQLRYKKKLMERNRRKPLPRLSYEKRGWNAPLDQPYVPVGRMTELVSAMEQVRSNLPHTRERFQKQTYRQMLMVKKRERDLLDKQRKNKTVSRDASRGNVAKSLSQSSDDGNKPEDPSRVVSTILPSERSNLLQIRNAAYDERVKDIAMGKRVSSGPRLNKFGRAAAGYVSKLQEKRDEAERKEKASGDRSRKQNMSPSAQAKLNNEPKVSKSHIEIQMENEKTRFFIRKRNGRIYDEKIKNLITTADNGSTLLKFEIGESENRLAAIKLGKSLHEVIPKNSNDFFTTDKESYFLGDKRALRRQEKTQIKQQQPKAEVSARTNLAKDFQTIASAQEINEDCTGGFFITEQPQTQTERQGMVRIPDLLDSLEAQKHEDAVTVQDMFSNARDDNYEKVFRATTDRVKGLFLGRVHSRKGQNFSDATSQLMNHNAFRNQRAHSMSTAAATQQLCTKSGANLASNNPISSLNSTRLESNRLQTAATERRVLKGRRRSQPINQHRHHGQQQNEKKLSAPVDGVRNHSAVNATVSYDTSSHMLNSNNKELTLAASARQDLSMSMTQPIALSQQDPKRLLKNARNKRAVNIHSALTNDIDNKKIRVKYLQTLQQDRIAKKKLDQAQGQKLFEGFSNEEMHEILIEMPQLKKMKNDMAKLISNGPQPPEFSNTQLIHLDSLHDIANRDKAQLLRAVKEQINHRKQRIQKHVDHNDVQYNLLDPNPAFIRSLSKSNAAIMKKFQQQTQDGYDEELEPNFNFHDTLKERLNIAEQKQQTKLYETFKNEDFVNKIWDENGLDRTMDSERLNNKIEMNNSGGVVRHATKQIVDGLQKMEQQLAQNNNAALMRRQTTTQQKLLDQTMQKQVEEELKEFDHSDQKIIMKLVEVFEKRQQKEVADNVRNKPSGFWNIGAVVTDKESSMKQQASKASFTDQQSSCTALNAADQESKQANQSNDGDSVGAPGKPKFARQHSKVMRSSSIVLNQQTASGDLNINSHRRKSNMPASAAIGSQQNMNQREKKRVAGLRKEYHKYLVDQYMKEYQRAFNALVGANDLDLELVIHSMSSGAFHRETREFLVASGKYMTDEHLIHLKEDPKTILNLYRIFMLKYKTHIMGQIDKKPVVIRKNGTGKNNDNSKNTSTQRNVNASSLSNKKKDGDESDYSDSDFQDLLSNKQIEENIRVFFDRMHELVNPIDPQRLKLDSVQQIKSTVKTFYKKKADVAQMLLQELDQKRAERPVTVRVKRNQFNDPSSYNQANMHIGELERYASVPQQQCQSRMADIRLNAELHRLRRFKEVAHKTAKWYNQLAAMILAEKIQDEPLVMYMLDQIKNVIEVGEVFSRQHFHRMIATFDHLDARKPEVLKVRNFLDELLPQEVGQNLLRCTSNEFSFQQLPDQPDSQECNLEQLKELAESKPSNKSKQASMAGSGRPPKPTPMHFATQQSNKMVSRAKAASRVTFSQEGP